MDQNAYLWFVSERGSVWLFPVGGESAVSGVTVPSLPLGSCKGYSCKPENERIQGEHLAISKLVTITKREHMITIIDCCSIKKWETHLTAEIHLMVLKNTKRGRVL